MKLLLSISYRDLKKLIEEGYLKNISDNSNFILFDKKELDSIKEKIQEIKEFWNYKTKVNRKININKLNYNKRSSFLNSFKLFLDKKTSSLNYLDSLLVRNSIFIIYIRRHLEEKKKKNINDRALNKLYINSLNKIIKLVKDTNNSRFNYYIGQKYIIYCNSCKSKDIIQTCKNCLIDLNYYSKIIVSFQINNFEISFYSSYRDIEIDNLNYEISLDYKDRVFLDSIEINDYHLETLKLNEVITELKNFINYKC